MVVFHCYVSLPDLPEGKYFVFRCFLGVGSMFDVVSEDVETLNRWFGLNQIQLTINT